ncbi:hypothetical protein C8R46DRAFT_1223505 [Mycena filopes]|nr:hypothetical protein C8R46DRAFT_1223505 [Mycena filopes]
MAPAERKLSPGALKISAILRASLRDPMNPDSLCVLAIEAATASDLLSINAPDVMAKDGNETQILRAIMHFLTYRRSAQEQRALVQKLQTCRCNVRDPAIKILHHQKDVLTQDAMRTVGELCQILSPPLSSLLLGKFRKTRRHAAPDVQPWPNSQSDIIPTPGGAKATVGALLAWASDLSNECFAVFPLLGALGRFWEPITRELFRTPLAFSLATQHLQLALDRYNPRMDDIETARQFVLPVLMCTDGFFFPLVVRDPQASLRALDPIFEQMAKITVRIRPILKAIGPLVGGANPWFDRMEGLIKNAQSPPPFYNPRNGPTFGVVFSQAVYIRNLNQCMHLECPKALGVKVSVCKRCGIVSYCDAKCQRPAWRAITFPHKHVCDLIHSLRVALHLEDNTEWDTWVVRPKDTVVADGRQTADFDEMCKRMQVSEQLSVMIGDDVFGLTEVKRARLDEREERERRQ